ncbi:MAG: ABC transporter permease subunit [Paracoccaceae bacterium]
MTTLSEEPRAFRLSMLIYDTRYRSMTIQIVALMGFLAVLAWLVNNTVENLAIAGKDFNFKFLSSRAGYDINQVLIQYTNDSTHGRATVIGILNTLLVAALGCVLATVVGAFVGILRLSKNWLISRMMAVYVEAFRNVPVLLWIIAFFAVLTELTPAPNAFRGDSPSASMFLWDTMAVTNRGTYFPEPLFSRSLGNIDFTYFMISIDLLAILAVLFASGWISARIKKHADAVQNATGVRPATFLQRLGISILPIVALMFILGLHLGKPELRGFNFQGGVHVLNSMIALCLALALYTGAFIAEIVRAGILAISKGQSEAAAALGLRPGRIMNLVILPQALRVIIPPLISQYLNLTKNSSLAIAVGYMDIKGTIGGITMNQTGRELESMLLMMFIYLVISLLISLAMNIYNSTVALKER